MDEVTKPNNRKALTASEVKLNDFFTRLRELSDPDEAIIDIGGREGLTKMLYDDCIDSAWSKRKAAMYAQDWEITGTSERIVDFVKDAIEPARREIFEGAMDAILFGYQPIELIWDDTAEWKIKQARAKKLIGYRIDRDGQLFLVDSVQKKTPVLREKYILVRNSPTYKNQYGKSKLARLYYPWLYRTVGWQHFSEYMQRLGIPFAHIKGNEHTDDDGNSLMSQLFNAFMAKKRVNVVTTPDDIQIDFKEASGRFRFSEFNNAAQENIFRSFLGETLTSLAGNNGSRALGQVHDGVRKEKTVADCALVSEAINRAIQYVCELNGIADSPVFRFKQTVTVAEKTEQNELHKGMFDIGVRFSPDYIARTYSLEDDDFSLVDTGGVDPQQFGFGEGHNCSDYNFELSKKQQAQIDLEIDAADSAPDFVDFDEVAVIIASVNTEKQLIEALTELAGSSDVEAIEAMARAMFQVRADGYRGE